MATRPSGYPRDPLERFYTPAWAVGALLAAYPRLRRADLLVDPCAGAGHILAACEAMGIARGNLLGADLAPPRKRVWAGEIRRADIRADPHPVLASRRMMAADVRALVLNPPYGDRMALALAAIEAAFAAAGRDGIVAALLPAAFDGRPSRAGLFRDNGAFAVRVTLTDRIRWENVPQKKAGPSSDHVWAVWDRGPGAPRQRVTWVSRRDGERELAAWKEKAA